MICPKCQKENNDQDIICSTCGNELKLSEATAYSETPVEVLDVGPGITIINNPAEVVDPNTNESTPQFFKKKIFTWRLIILIIFVALLVLGSIVLLVSIREEPEDKVIRRTVLNHQFDPEKPILIKHINKVYSYIDINGKKIHDSNYADATEYHGNFAVVKPIGKENLYQLIDRTGKVLATNKEKKNLNNYIVKYDLTYINEPDSEGIPHLLVYNQKFKRLRPDIDIISYLGKGYFAYKNDQTIGIVDYKEKIIYETDATGYLSLQRSEVTNSLPITYGVVTIANTYANLQKKVNAKSIIINCKTGEEIYSSNNYIEVRNNNIFLIHNGPSENSEVMEGLFIDNNKIAYKNSEGNASTIEYKGGCNCLIIAKKNIVEESTYYNLATNKIESIRPTVSNPNNGLKDWEKLTGYRKYKCDSGYGIKKDEKVIVPCQWKSIDYLNNDLYQYLEYKSRLSLIIVKNNKTSALYNINRNKIIYQFNTKNLTNYDDSSFIIARDKDTRQRIIYNTLTGKFASISATVFVEVKTNYVIVKENDIKRYYNPDLKLFYTEKVYEKS